MIGLIRPRSRHVRQAGLALLLIAVAALASITGPGPSTHVRAADASMVSLEIHKVVFGGSGNEVFTGTYSGPVSGTFAVSETTPFSASVPTGTYTITEDAPSGFTAVGGFGFDDSDPLACTGSIGGATGNATPGPVTVTLTADAIHPQKACLVNARATLSIHKVAFGGSGNEVFTGTYSGPVSGTFAVSETTPFSISVPTGTYTITEDAPSGFTALGGFTFNSLEPVACTASIGGDTGSAKLGPVTVTLTAGPGPNHPPQVCLVNARATLNIQKAALGGNGDEVFTGTYSGPVSGTFAVSETTPFSVSVPTGTYTITEDARSGFTALGGFTFDRSEPSICTGSIEGGAAGSAEPGPVIVTLTAGPGPDYTLQVCLVNQAVSEVDVTKHDDVDAAHGGGAGSWEFAITASGGGHSFGQALSTPRSDGSVQTRSVKFGDFSTTGTVVETNGVGIACKDQLVKSFQTTVGENGPIGTMASFSSDSGTAATVDFYNEDCGQVLGAGTLDVVKVNDLNGNGMQDPGEGTLSSWAITVSCPGRPDLHGVTPAHFDGLPNNTSCGVTETPQAGYNTIGWHTSDAGTVGSPLESDGAGVTTSVHVDDGDRILVGFFNQPVVSIRVTKLVVAQGTVDGAGGWEMTVSGCGQQRQQTTDASGLTVFSDLPLCPTGYTVAEDLSSKPGFASSGPTSTHVFATVPGAVYSVRFTNVDLTTICISGCGPVSSSTPAATPTAAAPSPTASPSPTATPTKARPTASATVPVSASPTDVVLGARTPGRASVTPAAPSTGSGAPPATSWVGLVLATLGLTALGVGLTVLAAANRR